MNSLLQSKLILVTGASSGIGRAWARKAAQMGARVIGMGRDLDRLRATFAEVPGHHLPIKIDIKSIDDFRDLVVALAAEHGPIFSAFHAAGSHHVKSARLETDASFNSLLDSAMRGTVGLIAAAMKRDVFEDGGRLVVMSSVSAKNPSPGLAAYGSVKAAIDLYCRASASELAKRKITINTIVAGMVNTEMAYELSQTSTNSAQAALKDRHPLGFGQVDDIVGLLAYLNGPAARWMTGSELVLDGGYLSR